MWLAQAAALAWTETISFDLIVLDILPELDAIGMSRFTPARCATYSR
jgi:hypothetical protein